METKMKTKNNEQMFQTEVLEERMEMARLKWFARTTPGGFEGGSSLEF